MQATSSCNTGFRLFLKNYLVFYKVIDAVMVTYWWSLTTCLQPTKKVCWAVKLGTLLFCYHSRLKIYIETCSEDAVATGELAV